MVSNGRLGTRGLLQCIYGSPWLLIRFGPAEQASPAAL